MAKLSAATAETHTLTAAEKKAAKLSAAETPTSTAAEKKAAKMSSSNNDELVKFLISCIRHGVNGKIDFDAVAKECDIVSKGAAAKRWERLLKAHNIVPAAALNPRDASVASVKRTKAAGTPKKEVNPKGIKAAAEKKRKEIESRIRFTDSEDDEVPSPLAYKNKHKRIKLEVKDIKKGPIVKTEGGIDIDANGNRHIHHTVLPFKRESSSEESARGVLPPSTQPALDPSLKYQDNDLLEQYVTSSSLEQTSASPAAPVESSPASAVKAKKESVVIDVD
ncbi:MAG: hypothetical protein LQ350_005320 [Teloschistes chrysophthalmus]|nr:MAG: hypothetical protein LQ350_005320 [Niorma chrysophthalma]